MSIFQNSVLNKHLKTLDDKFVESSYKKYVAYFHNPEVQKNIREVKEEQFQEGFLRELFVNILGYTLNPNPNYNLTTEHKNEKGAKKADGAILQNGKALGVIELKGTDTKDLDKINVQAFNYKNNQSACLYVVTSNFEKLRFFIDNAVEHIEFNLFTLTIDEFKVLWLCLNVDSILSGIPQKVKEESLLAEENITKQLYKDYSTFKTDLWQNMVKNHPKDDQLMLFKKTQKLLDRFLFIFFAEDGGLLPPNSISRIVKRWTILQEEDAYKPLYEIFKQYFNYINTGRKGKSSPDDIFAYNGGLFLDDLILDKIKLDDEVLYEHVINLTKYDFQSEIDVNILGHIFENSLNEIENITALLEGKEIDKSKTKRKKDGVFYTPKYITKYIVENTVGKLCEEKKKEYAIIDEEYAKGRRSRKKDTIKRLDQNLQAYRNWLLNITICDPACGSGAFLNQALEFLIDEHAYIDELNANLFSRKDTKTIQTAFGILDVANHVLEKNLFGVDINEESVDIAKLSLWLRTAQRGRKLTSLNNNIKCGNSLIEDPTVVGEKAFNWRKEFPTVFEKGGFDVVIGNPPYGASFNDNHKEYIIQTFKSYQYKFESYLYFYEKGIEILRNGGFLSYITPEMFLRLEKSRNIRQFILNNSCLTELKFYGENVFKDVKVNTVILTLRKSNISPKHFKIIPESGVSWDFSFEDWTKEPLLKIEYKISPIIKKIIEKIDVKSVRLGSVGEAIQGLTPYDRYRGQSKELIEKRGFHFNEKVDESCGKWLDGKHVNRYILSEGSEWLRYGDWLAAPREKRFFEGARLLYREVPGKNKRIQATYAEKTYYHGHSITPFILKDRSKVEELSQILAVTNSKLVSWYIKFKSSNFSKNTFPKLNPKDIKYLPIPKNINDLEYLGLNARNIMKMSKDLQKQEVQFTSLLLSKFDFEKLSGKLQNWHELEFKDFLKELKKVRVQLSLSEETEWMQYFNKQKEKALDIKAEIDKTDREIDQMLYELYELSDEEIKILEN